MTAAPIPPASSTSTTSAPSKGPAVPPVPSSTTASAKPSRLLNRRRYEGHPRAIDIADASSPWSTPFPPSRTCKVVDTYTMFEAWARRSPDARARWIRSHIGELVGKDIMCDCNLEEYCHGHILIEMIEEAAAEPNATGSTQTAPAGWVRVSLPASDGTDGLVCFGIEVSDYSRHGRVTNAATIARWMIGHTCADIARWIRERGGSAVRIDRIHAHLERTRRLQNENQPRDKPYDLPQDMYRDVAQDVPRSRSSSESRVDQEDR